MATDYYSVLGIGRDASQDQIKKAFRRLARELHPDVNPDPKTQERFKEINAAYEVLSDPQKKQVYDLGGDPSRRRAAARARAASARASATSPTSWTRSSAPRRSAGRARAPAAARTP